MDLEKSPEAREKEARIEELHKQIKRTLATIKQLKTRMSKMKDRVNGLQRGMFTQANQMQDRMYNALRELEQLAAFLREDQRLPKEERDSINSIYEDLKGGLGGELPDMEEEARQQGEQREKAESFDPFREFAVEPPKEEQREIRQVYLRLSKQFHPDRAPSAQEQERYHQIQQQITEAYKRHDIHALFELEQRLGEPEAPADGDAGTVDAMDSKIADLEHQLSQLKRQKERLSLEIKQFRKSDMGKMLTEADSIERQGSSLEESMGFHKAEGAIELMEAIRDAMKDTKEKGKLSPMFDRLLMQFSGLMGIADEFEADEDWMEDFFFGDEEDTNELNPDPTFPEGTFVRLTTDEELSYQEDPLRSQFSLKGLNGEVVEAYLEEGDPFYTVLLDITSLKLLPRSYIADNFQDFEFLQFVEEDWLAVERRRRRPKEELWMKAIRELRYTHGLKFLPDEQQERLRSILLTAPELDDGANWAMFLDKHLPFPIKVKTRGLELDWKVGSKGKLTDFVEYDKLYGLIVEAKIGKVKIPAPLYEFAGDESPEKNQILEDYFTWADALLGVNF